jgi:hypothetical protein
MTAPILIPEVESDIPLPASAVEALPELSVADELAMRARTIKLLSDISGNPIIPSQESVNEASDIAKKMLTDPKTRPEFSRYPNETIAFLAGMVSQMNCQIVDELSELKLYCVNQLVKEIETSTDAKTRIMAIKLLGEVEGVDAYKRRTETTVIIKPIQEVEQELKSLLEGIEYTIIPKESVSEDVHTDETV